MTVDQTANFVRGGVSSSVSSTATTINVDNASEFPDPSNGNYNLVIWDFDQYRRPDLDPDVEVLRVSGRDTTNNTLTVTRGQEGTTAVSHPNTSELHLSPTSKVFTDIDSKITSNISVTGSNGLSGGSAQLGGSLDVSINGNLSLDSDLVAADGEIIWDESSTYIPQSRLQNDAITVAGNSVSLGDSTVINHSNLSNITSDQHHVKYSDEEAQDSVGTILGSNFTYNDSTPSITIDDNFVLNTGDTMSGALTIEQATSENLATMRESATGDELRFDINSSDEFEINSFDASANTERSGIRVSPSTGQVYVENNSQFNADIDVGENNLLSVNTITSSSGNSTFSITEPSNSALFFQADSSDGSIELHNGINSNPNNSRLIRFAQNEAINLQGGIDEIRFSDKGTKEITFDPSPTSNYRANISWQIDGVDDFSIDWDGGVASPKLWIYDSVNNSRIIEFEHGGDVSIPQDDVKLKFGANQDFDIEYESSSDELVVSDSNNVELIRQPKGGPTEFLQGIDAGSIEAPEDSFTQLANTSVTSALTSGDRVGYTFAVDNQTIASIEADADGSGGVNASTKKIGMPAVVIGNDATRSVQANQVVVGQGTSVSQNSTTAVGSNSSIVGQRSVLLGDNSTASGNSTVAVGQGVTASGNDSISIGRSSSSTAAGSVALGFGVTASVQDAIAIRDGATARYPDDAGAQSITDFSVTSSPSAGTEQSYSFDIDGTTIAKIFAEADGAGGIQNSEVVVSSDLTDGTNVIYDQSASEIPDSAMGTIGATTLNLGVGVENNSGSLRVDEDASLTWTSSQTFDSGLTSNGAIDLSTNSINNVTVVGGSNGSFDFTGSHVIFEHFSGSDVRFVDENFDDSLRIYDSDESVEVSQGNLVDGSSNVIYDQSASEIPDSAMGSIDNSTLTNNSVTVTAGDGLKNGGSVSLGGSTTLDVEPLDFAGAGLQDDGSDNLELVNDSITVTAGDGLKNGGSVSLGGSTTLDVEPANFAGTFLSDDGSDNLTVNTGRGIENDGSGNLQFDEDTSYTFTTSQTINSDLTLSGLLDTGRVVKHSTDITQSLNIGSGEGVVMAGPVTGNSAVTGSGNFRVVGEERQFALDVRNAINNDSDHSSTASHSHTDLSNITSDDHHVKTTSASELSDVSSDSVSGAHHTKTTSASGLTDVSADSVSGAHHTKTTEAQVLSMTTSSSQNVNQTTTVQWDEHIVDGDPAFSHDPSTSDTDVTINEEGTYKIYCNLYTDTTSSRTNPSFRFRVNGTEVAGRSGSAYARDAEGHTDTSTSLEVFQDLVSGDTVNVYTFAEASGGNANLQNRRSIFTIQKVK